MQASYIDRGEGPSVLLVHCSSASHRQWRFLDTVLAGHYRTVAPDLLGYGRSSPWPRNGAGVADSDLDLLIRLIETIGGPVHIVAHSYGAAVALDAARIDAGTGGAVASLCLIEPVSFHLLKGGADPAAWRTISAVARACSDAVAAGKPKRAANAYMGFWIGSLRWRLAPRRFRQEVMRTIHKVADEFKLMFESNERPSDYAEITCPLTLVRGGRSPQPAARVVGLLDDALDQAQTIVIPSAGHMSPFTHRADIARIVQRHLAACAF